MSLVGALARVATVLLFLSSTSLAGAEAAPASLPPKPDFTMMMFLTGNWSCSVKDSRRSTAYQVMPTGSISSDGYWLIRKATIKAPWVPREMTSEDRITYERAASRWIRINTNDEGHYDISTSPGWSGNSITWTFVTVAAPNATESTNTWTMTKVSDTETTSQTSTGGLVTATSNCRKIS